MSSFLLMGFQGYFMEYLPRILSNSPSLFLIVIWIIIKWAPNKYFFINHIIWVPANHFVGPMTSDRTKLTSDISGIGQNPLRLRGWPFPKGPKKYFYKYKYDYLGAQNIFILGPFNLRPSYIIIITNQKCYHNWVENA